MKRIKILTLWMGILLTLTASAQQSLPINLQTVLEMGGANNLTIKEFLAKQELASADFSKTKEWWLPDFYAGLQTNQLWGAVMNGNGNFFLDVNRGSLWTGLGLNANWNLAQGIFKTKAAKLKVLASAFETQAEKNKALLQAIKAYYNLQIAQLKYVAYKNLVQQSDTITKQIEVQVNAGLRYQSELLLAKSNYSHLKIEMLYTQSEYNSTSSELVRLLNLDPETKLVSVDSLLMPLEFHEESLTINDKLYQNRPEIKFIDLSIRSMQAEKKTATTGLLIPRLSIGTYGSYFGGLRGKVNPMNTASNPEIKQLYPTGLFSASLQWNIPLGRLVYGGDLKKYNSLIKIQETKAAQFKTQINEEIANATQQLIIGKEQVQIATDALDLTAEALSQSMERQKLGTAKPFEVFQAQQFYMQTQLDYLKAVAGFNKAQFSLKVAKGEIL